MKTAEDIDCEGTDEVTCPYCGYTWDDSWEFGDIGVIHCYYCSNDFKFEAEYSTTYSTAKIKCDDSEAAK